MNHIECSIFFIGDGYAHALPAVERYPPRFMHIFKHVHQHGASYVIGTNVNIVLFNDSEDGAFTEGKVTSSGSVLQQ